MKFKSLRLILAENLLFKVPKITAKVRRPTFEMLSVRKNQCSIFCTYLNVEPHLYEAKKVVLIYLLT